MIQLPLFLYYSPYQPEHLNSGPFLMASLYPDTLKQYRNDYSSNFIKITPPEVSSSDVYSLELGPFRLFNMIITWADRKNMARSQMYRKGKPALPTASDPYGFGALEDFYQKYLPLIEDYHVVIQYMRKAALKTPSSVKHHFSRANKDDVFHYSSFPAFLLLPNHIREQISAQVLKSQNISLYDKDGFTAYTHSPADFDKCIAIGDEFRANNPDFERTLNRLKVFEDLVT